MNKISKLFFKNLIERKIIKPDTEIDASYRGRDMAGDQFVRSHGTFIIRKIEETEASYTFACASVIDGHTRVLGADSITMIDGMDPERVAETYGVRLSGEIVEPGRRRGRKPKARTPEPEIVDEDDLDDEEDAE